MAGLMDTMTAPQQASAQGAPQGSAIPTSSDPILKQIQDGIDKSVSPNIRRDYLSIVVAGMKVLNDPQAGQRIVSRLQSTNNLVSDVSQGTANIMAVIANNSGGQFNVAAIGPASVVLMCQILDMAEKTANLKLTPDLAAQCTKATVDAVLEKFGINQNKVQAVVQSGQSQQGQNKAA